MCLCVLLSKLLESWYSLLINLSNSIIYIWFRFQFVVFWAIFVLDIDRNKSISRPLTTILKLVLFLSPSSHNYTWKFLLLIAVLYQKRYKRERRLRTRLQQQVDVELKKRNQIEEILKSSGAPAEAIRILTAGNYNHHHDTSSLHALPHCLAALLCVK